MNTILNFVTQNWWLVPLAALAIAAFFVVAGFVVIGEEQVGIVVKKFAAESLPEGRFAT